MGESEGTWVEVRTDLFDPIVYLQLELNYKDMISKIYEFGGYITFTQFFRLADEKKRNGNYIVRKLIDELHLLGEHQFNNNKYAYLKTRSMQYIKQTLTAKAMGPRPNNHVLMTSIYKAEYYLTNKILLQTEIDAARFSKLQDQIRVKCALDAPFDNPAAFLDGINRLHYSRCFLVRTRNEDKALHVKFAVIDFDRSKTWFLNLLRRLDSFFGYLNSSCTYSLEILVKNRDREIAINKLCSSLLRDNKNRIEVKERMLKSHTPTGQVRVQQMDNLIFRYCSELNVFNLDINRYFLHSSSSKAHVLKYSEIDQLKEIKKDILEKQKL